MRFFFLPFRQRSRNDVARGRILSLHPTSRGEMYTEAVCVGLERASNSLHCGSICKADEWLSVGGGEGGGGWWEKEGEREVGRNRNIIYVSSGVSPGSQTIILAFPCIRHCLPQ